MKVIFQQDVRGQGKKGEMKEVSEGYGRNYLLPRGLAVEANKDNLNTLALKEKARKAQEARERAEAEEAAAKLKDVIVTVRAKAGANGRLFGSVTSQEIVDALREQHGVSIEKNRIVQAEPIKSFGSFEVKCKFGYGIDAPCSCSSSKVRADGRTARTAGALVRGSGTGGAWLVPDRPVLPAGRYDGGARRGFLSAAEPGDL